MLIKKNIQNSKYKKKVIENIYIKLHEMENYSYDTRLIQLHTFLFVIFTFIKC